VRGDTWIIQLGAGCSARLVLAPTGERDGVLDATLQIRLPSKRVSREYRFLWRPIYIRELDVEPRRICVQVLKAGAPQPIDPPVRAGFGSVELAS
jgi:hypothetical protein